MCERWLATGCLVVAACGGSDGAGPTTSHHLVGSWSYEMPNIQDGHGMNCAITGPILTLSQSGVQFSGQVNGGNEACTYLSAAFGGPMSSAAVLNGAIRGDSVTFDVLNTKWHNVGTFITEDSMAGVVNSFTTYQGQQYSLVGYWYSKRQ